MLSKSSSSSIGKNAVEFACAIEWKEPKWADMDEDLVQGIPDMKASVMAVENILRYRFKQKKLLEEALTHPSCTESASYQRLEFIGDATLGSEVSIHIFRMYPYLDPGKLSLLRSVNISSEKLARVAVRHCLYQYLRHNITGFDEKVREFVMAVKQEQEIEIYGGLVKAPKVLADIVESIAAAVLCDCNYDSRAMWEIFRYLLEPIVTPDVLARQQQPVTMLFELCQKEGKDVIISYQRVEDQICATVTIDRNFVASVSSEQKENAKLLAARAALKKLSYTSCDHSLDVRMFNQLNVDGEIEEAKQKLHELCDKKKWPKPKYIIEKESGLAHQKRYTCCVEIETSDSVLYVSGYEKRRVREGENSAASAMLFGLKDSYYV